MIKYVLITIAFVFLSSLSVSAEEDIESVVSSGDALSDSPSELNNDVAVLADLLTSIDENLETMALDTTVNAYQVSEYYVNYFRGVLQNMPETDYLCYAERVPISGSTGYYNYITHYYLFYDLEIVNGQIVSGSYPCIDVYSQDNVYYLEEYQKTFEGYPTLGYASFAPYSALIDRSFPVNDLLVALLAVLVLWILGRKTLFS